MVTGRGQANFAVAEAQDGSLGPEHSAVRCGRISKRQSESGQGIRRVFPEVRDFRGSGQHLQASQWAGFWGQERAGWYAFEVEQPRIVSCRRQHVVNVGRANFAVRTHLKHGPLKGLVDERRCVPGLRNRIAQKIVSAKVLKGRPKRSAGRVHNRIAKASAAASLRVEEAVMERKAVWARRGACRWKRDERSYPEARGSNPELADGDQSSSRRPHAQESTDVHRDAVRVRRFTGGIQT